MSWLTKLFGTDEEIERGKALDAAIAAENQKLVDRGVWSKDVYDQYERNAAAQSADTYEQQVDDAFDEGWEEGKRNEIGFLRDLAGRLIGDPAAVVLASIPWWVWALVAAYLAWQLGLFKRLLK